MFINRKNRWENWNYNTIGLYFVTIVTKDRVCYFWENSRCSRPRRFQACLKPTGTDTIELNDFGKIAHDCWMDIPNHYPECELDEFVIMPNHIHGILVLSDTEKNIGNKNRNTERIPSIVGSFKSAVSNKIHLLGEKGFRWQKSFHDRVIRNDRELFLIRRYIRNNPANWERDRLAA